MIKKLLENVFTARNVSPLMMQLNNFGKRDKFSASISLIFDPLGTISIAAN